MELEPFGVSVTSIIPAFVKSEIIASAIERQDWCGTILSQHHMHVCAKNKRSTDSYECAFEAMQIAWNSAIAKSHTAMKNALLTASLTADRSEFSHWQDSQSSHGCSSVCKFDCLIGELKPEECSSRHNISCHVTSDHVTSHHITSYYGSRLEKAAADSYYAGIMPRIWEISKVMGEKGISCERAADDIARAMAKPKPPRFVRTGDNPLLFLFGERLYSRA